MRGHVYFLENPVMPGLIKIGFTTTSLEQRLSELNTTGVPEDFIVGASFYVCDAETCEKALHALFSQHRIRDQREFFRLSLKEALDQSLTTVMSYVETSGVEGKITQKIGGLDDLDHFFLEMLIHSDQEEMWPEYFVKNCNRPKQEVMLHLGELVAKGFLKERQEAFALTHKGRKYAFDNGLADSTLLPKH